MRDRENTEHILEAPIDMGLNVMDLCKSYELPVKGTCGGVALCATCQVYVRSAHELPAPSDDEMNMLDQAFFVQPNSRLGCQIKINTRDLDGLELTLAPDAE